MLNATTFLVIDTETTGLEPSLHRVVEVAAVLVVRGQIVSAFTSYVNPLRSIPPITSAIHGLVDADVVDAPTLPQLLPRLNALVQEADVLVAHNAPFDKAMLPGLDEKPWLDTVKLAQYVYPELSSYRNQSLRYELKLNCPEAAGMPAHRALSDAYVTARLLIRLLEDTEGDCLDLIREVEQPRLEKVCNFPKHRGVEWKEVPKDYLAWLGSRGDLSGNVRYTVEYWLKKE